MSISDLVGTKVTATAKSHTCRLSSEDKCLGNEENSQWC